MTAELRRRLFAECLGTALLLAVLTAAAPVLLILSIGARLAWTYVLPNGANFVDLHVYVGGAATLANGGALYDYVYADQTPDFPLPFTYPPIAALLSVPLAFVPFEVAAWGWTIAQLAADVAIVWFAWYRLRERVGVWAPVLVGVVAAGFLWTQPVGDGIRFAQVNAFLVLICLLDLQRPRHRWLARVPPGVLVGLAMAIKLTPGVFVIHYLLGRRWAGCT